MDAQRTDPRIVEVRYTPAAVKFHVTRLLWVSKPCLTPDCPEHRSTKRIAKCREGSGKAPWPVLQAVTPHECRAVQAVDGGELFDRAATELSELFDRAAEWHKCGDRDVAWQAQDLLGLGFPVGE